MVGFVGEGVTMMSDYRVRGYDRIVFILGFVSNNHSTSLAVRVYRFSFLSLHAERP